MKDRSKTKQTLIQELTSLRERIAELEQAESERKRQDNELRLDREILANMEEGVHLTHVDNGVIIYVNRCLENMFGYDSGELVGKHVSILNAPGDKSPRAFANEIIKSLKQVGAWRGEVHNIRKNGTSFWCYANVSKFRHPQYGEVWISVHQDITDRKQLNEALRDSELWMKNIFNALDESVLVVTSDRRLININPATQKIFGYSQKELFNQSTEILHVDHEHYLEFGRRIRNAFDKEETASFEFEARRKGGEIFPTEHTVSLLKNEKGKPKGIVSVVRDITKRKRAEEQLRASLQEKEILLREIQHRVKNNLQVISGLLDLQARSSGNPELSELLNESQSRIRSMAMVHEKLYGSKDFTRINLAGYVRTLSQELLQSYKINPGEIDLIFQTDGDVYVDINKAIPCGLILNELISNALRHAFPGDEPGEIKIIIGETKNKDIEIVVRDNGMGLPDDVDIHQPRTVGLYLVNGLVKNQLDGLIEGIRDGGTGFRIKFPL